MARSVTRMAAFALLLAATACTASESVPADPASTVLSRFRDPFGRQPFSLSLGSGTHLRVAYVDSLFDLRSPGEQRRQAHAIARSLWAAAFGGARGGADTVSVAFTRREGTGSAATKQTTHVFLFYREQLHGAATGVSAP